MFSTLNRYFSRELCLTFLAVSGVLLLVIAGKSFISLLGRVVEGKLPADVVLTLLGLGILNSAILLIPFALLIALMLTLGRLYRDSEIYAIKASGVGTLGLLKNASLLVIPIVLALIYLSLFSGPWAVTQVEKLKLQARANTDIFALVPGRFIESKHGNWVVFVEEFDKNSAQAKNIFIYDKQKNHVAIETAESAEQQKILELGGDSLILKQGQRYEGKPGAGDFTVLNFGQHAIRVPQVNTAIDNNDAEFKSSKILFASNRPEDHAELQWRLSIPIAAILLVLLAFPLSVTSPRQGRFAKLGIVIVIYLIYSNLIILAESWVATGKIPVYPGVYSVHIAMLIFIAFLMLRKQQFS